MLPISVCTICKNEEKHLEKFLTSLKKYDWEIIIADTGSTDRSVEIASKYADKVLTFPWQDDFSAARNFCISAASNDDVLILDCDEYLIDADVTALTELMQQHPHDLGRIFMNNYYEMNGATANEQCRLERFFNRKFFQYQFTVHEQISQLTEEPFVSYDIPITVDHVGYHVSKEQAQEKTKRNLQLLFKELEKEPQNPYFLFQVGKSYQFVEDYESALQYYAKAIISPSFNPTLDYTQTLVCDYGDALLTLGRAEEALSLLNMYSFYDYCSDFHCLLGRIYFHNQKPLEAMLEYIKATNCDIAYVKDSKDNVPYYNMGYINELLGDKEAALTHYKRCHDFPMAEARIQALTMK